MKTPAMVVSHGPSGLVLVCTRAGVLERVVRDDLGLGSRIVPGQGFAQLVDLSSVDKAGRFLAALQANQWAFDWELHVPLGSEVIPLYFAGSTTAEGLVIIGATTRAEVVRLAEERLAHAGTPASALRATLQAFRLQAQTHTVRDTALVEELARLNNELVTAQRALARQNRELEHIQAQQNLFLGMAAHDLRNPLHAIRMYSEFLRDDAAAELSAEHMQFVSRILAYSDFMARLVDDLLDVVRINAGHLTLDCQPTDVSRLIEDVVTLNRVFAERKHIRLLWRAPESLPTVPMDATKITQVLTNLIMNGVQFSPAQSLLAVEATRSGNAVVIAVRDAGPGIPAQEQAALFQPFSSTSVRSTAGERSTGLGLLICRKIIEGHHGRLWVESTVGSGSTFAFSLPVTPESEESPHG